MAFYQFRREQLIKSSLEEVWEFVSAPQNLKVITPPEMGFDILTPNLPGEMYAGMIISYRVSPLLGIPTTWVTEITHIEAKRYFVDEQRVGPYALWHHQHLLEETDEGILMKDIVSYSPPFGPLGKLANRFIIQKKLAEIFDFRHQAMNKLFPA